MYNILLIGGSLSNNEGAAAMTITATNLVKKYITNSIIIISTPHLKDDMERNKYFKFKLIEKEELLTLNPKKIFNQLLRLKNKFENLQHYYTADLIIDVTGDMYSDDYGFLSSFFLLKELIYPIFFKKPIIIFPQSIGPFKSKFTLNFAKFIFNNCKIVIAREKKTKKILDEMNLNTRVELIDDVAFLLKPIQKNKLKKIIKQNRIPKDQLLIGVSLSQSIARFSSANTSEKYDEYLLKMTNLINYLTKLGHVILISHVGGNSNKKNDDFIINEAIYNKAINKHKINFIKKRYLPDVWKGIISQCNIFIGARMHANIAALSSNVPTIAIAYSHKFYGIMERFAQSNYVFDIMNLNQGELINKVNELLSNKNKIIETLKRKNATFVNNEKILSTFIIKELKNKNK